ncbi:MAG: glycosyltransferase [Thomasclavelia sp.]
MEKYLIKQLQSINNQTNKIDEVILIDDCSKDRSVEIVEEFIKESQLDNWKLIINNENLGYKNNFKKDYR